MKKSVGLRQIIYHLQFHGCITFINRQNNNVRIGLKIFQSHSFLFRNVRKRWFCIKKRLDSLKTSTFERVLIGNWTVLITTAKFTLLDKSGFSSEESVYGDKLTTVLQFNEADEIAVDLVYKEFFLCDSEWKACSKDLVAWKNDILPRTDQSIGT